MPKVVDLSGKRVGKLLVIDVSHTGKKGSKFWNCICDCGKSKVITSYTLHKKRIKSCGCSRKPRKLWKSGLCQTTEYRSWYGMIRRCSPGNNYYSKNYYDRGIRVWEGWLEVDGFRRFLEYMGPKPKPIKDWSLDRINNDGNYEPGNVRWADRTTQSRNQRRKAAIDNFSDEEILAEAKKRGLIS